MVKRASRNKFMPIIASIMIEKIRNIRKRKVVLIKSFCSGSKWFDLGERFLIIFDFF